MNNTLTHLRQRHFYEQFSKAGENLKYVFMMMSKTIFTKQVQNTINRKSSSKIFLKIWKNKKLELH